MLLFQKSHPINNLLKAPVLVINLDKHLNSDQSKSKIEINRIQVDRHTCVLSANNHIVLSNDISFFDANEKVDINALPQYAKGLDDVNVIPIEQSKKEPDSEEYQKLRNQYLARYASARNDETKIDEKGEQKKQLSLPTLPMISNANSSISPILWNSNLLSSPSLISNANANPSFSSKKERDDEKRSTSPKPRKP